MDIDYAELFGIELNEGANEQEPADPAAAGETEGANEQALAEPAGEETNEGSAAAAEQADEDADSDNAEAAAGDNAEGDGNTPPGGQSDEDNARFAAARRRAEAERDAAIARIREESAKQVDEAFASAGLTNPYTGTRIQSKADFDAYKARQAEEQRKTVMNKAGMSGEDFDAFLEAQPVVQQARQAQAEAQQAAQAARQAEAAVQIEEQLRQITALDPAIRSIEDLPKMPNYDRFYELVKKGNDLADAYKLANFDRLSQRQAEASRQAALNAASSKGHLRATGSRGSGAVSVPEDVKEMYRIFNPDATDAEIQTHYNRTHKG